MTYEFAKLVADNLRFGSYKDKQIQFETPQSTVIGDVNSNTYISFYISNKTEWKEVKNKWTTKSDWEKLEEGVLISVYTGILNPKMMETDSAFSINIDNPDYKFWKEFQTFIEAAYNDKIYKHNCVIEDAFYV